MSRRCRSRLLRLGVAAATLAAAVAIVPAAHGSAVPADAPPAAARTETPVATDSPVSGVAESVVRVRIPLPASVGPHPAACDWLSYLRYRDRNGPTDPEQADRVLIAQPGILEGAGAFDSVARDTVAQAAAQGRHVEFWALDRRSNCLDDHTGIAAALAARDPQVAIGYYLDHREVGGRTFAGFATGAGLAWLAHVGLQQTEQDQYDLMRAELPDPHFRSTRVLCGGHSLGGVLTGFFAEWNFGGVRGADQCAGYFALDSVVATSLSSLNGMTPDGNPASGLTYTATQAALTSGLLPRTTALPALINPESMTLLAIAGLEAEIDPTGISTLAASLPSDPNTTIDLRLLFANSPAQLLTGQPDPRTFRMTNQAVLGALLDDNSQTLAFLEDSVGFFDGGPLTQKTFPNLAGLGLSAVAGPDLRAVPTQPNGPVYGWLNYNQVGTAADPRATTADGTPYTSAASEVTDIQELARSLSEQPLDFTEAYFPTKLVTDLYESQSPQIAAFVTNPAGISAHPVITFLGGDGIVLQANGGKIPAEAVNPVICPGYNHLDVLTAAPVQNNGRPEPVSTGLAAWALRI